jgi:hypothetical protein
MNVGFTEVFGKLVADGSRQYHQTRIDGGGSLANGAAHQSHLFFVFLTLHAAILRPWYTRVAGSFLIRPCKKKKTRKEKKRLQKNISHRSYLCTSSHFL